jgi:asparagine synthase (glutamine-hydrolysing)
MWSFVVYDKEKEKIFCSRDRFGIKPFYYLKKNNKFYFASEIKQFDEIKNFKKIINTARAYDFLAYEIINHTNETLIKDFFQLRGGYNLIINLTNMSHKIYKWYKLPNVKSNDSFEIAKEKFYNLLNDSIRIGSVYNEVEDIDECLEEIDNNYEAIQRNNINFAKKYFSSVENAKKYLQIYKKLVKND